MPLRKHLDVRGMKRGDVISRGNRIDLNKNGRFAANECDFDYGVVLQPGQSLSTVVGAGCTMLVDGLTEFSPTP